MARELSGGAVERRSVIVAGFGFRSQADIAALRAAFDRAQRGQAPVTHLATAQDKLATLAPLAEALGLPAIGIAPAALAAAKTIAHSPASLAVRGVGSVAEASALAAATMDGRRHAWLAVARQISPDRMATCAIAQGTPI
jgi:cobalt-precorrin 5A hydrolase